MDHYKMKKKNIFAGYINLKPINGIIFPSYAQNQINKDYIENELKGQFFMSTNENTYGKNNIILRSLLDEKRLKGVCLLSVFSLPNEKQKRIDIYKKLLKKRKEFHFVFEQKSLRKKSDILDIEEIFIFNNAFFTNKKTKLSNFEKGFIDKTWSFV